MKKAVMSAPMMGARVDYARGATGDRNVSASVIGYTVYDLHALPAFCDYGPKSGDCVFHCPLRSSSE